MIYRQQGFSLIELIMVMVLLGIMATMSTWFFTVPFTEANKQETRSLLVDQAELILQSMAHDVHSALPNSVRVNGAPGTTLELIPTVSGGLYRKNVVAAGDLALDISVDTNPPAHNRFNVIGADLMNKSAINTLVNLAGHTGETCTSYTLGTGEDCHSNTSVDCLVINNQANSGAVLNAYNSASNNAQAVVSITSSTSTTSVSDLCFDNKSTLFPSFSPRQRFYIVGSAVTYDCDTTSKQITRYSNYALQEPQPAAPIAGATSALLADNASCEFDYNVGAIFGLLTIKITLAKNGEQVSLIHQIHVINVP